MCISKITSIIEIKIKIQVLIKKNSQIESEMVGKSIHFVSKNLVRIECVIFSKKNIEKILKILAMTRTRNGSQSVMKYDFFPSKPKSAIILKISFLSRKYPEIRNKKKSTRIQRRIELKSQMIVPIVPIFS